MLLRGASQLLNGLKEEQIPRDNLSRRAFLQASVAVAGGCALGQAWADTQKERQLTLYAPNTGEMIRMAYWTPTEGYIQESIDEISLVMRDRHNGDVIDIDPRLLDQIYVLSQQLEPRQPVHLLCGYRSPETNARLRKTHRGVAKDSLHMRGMAADIRMPDRDFSRLHELALSLQAGGVGRYRRSRFIHIDTGPVRSWG